MVSKDRVYNVREGYLIFFNRQKIFVPQKEISKNDFLGTTLMKSGYIVEFDKEEEVLYNIAEKYTIDYNYSNEGNSKFIRDTIRVIPVKIGSLPYKYKSKKGKETVLTFRFNDMSRKVKYFNTNNEAVWSVYPFLDEDLKKAANYYH